MQMLFFAFMYATAELILDIRRAYTSGIFKGHFPVKLRVTFLREQRYYKTPYCFQSKEGFEKSRKKENKLQFSNVENKALEIIKELGDSFTFDMFDKIFLKNRSLHDSLESAFNDAIAELEEDRIGAKQSYQCSKRSFLKYSPKAKLSDVTPKWLKEYERKMLEAERSITTVGMYTRDLRTVFNREMSLGNISQERYPFGRRKYEPPTGVNVKKALVIEEVEKIFNYKPKSATEGRMRDYWIFIYLCYGINVTDFCNLKRKNMKDNQLSFVRQKTKRTKRVEEAITIDLSPKALSIIKRHGNKSLSPDSYLFPHLTDSMTYEEKDKTAANLVRLINDYMKEIAIEIEINKPVTTYYARHSFATIMLNGGAPVPMISKMLGHGSIPTTENYLGGFEKDQVKKATAILLDFKKENYPKIEKYCGLHVGDIVEITYPKTSKVKSKKVLVEVSYLPPDDANKVHVIADNAFEFEWLAAKCKLITRAEDKEKQSKREIVMIDVDGKKLGYSHSGNEDRTGHYGLRVGDIVEIRNEISGKAYLAEVTILSPIDTNKVTLIDDRGIEFDWVAEYCKVITPVERKAKNA